MQREETTCRYCMESIKVDAVKCRHCQSAQRSPRQHAVLAATERMATAVPGLSMSPAEAACYQKGGSKAQIQDCLDDCRAVAAAEVVHEQLHKELTLEFFDIVWGGGDIDPLPLERELRRRFSNRHPDRPPR